MDKINSDKLNLVSPLRYPGGKGLLSSYFGTLMEENALKGCKYFEPFAGGGGVALGLLSNGVASEIILNDADYHIYCFWKAIIERNHEFVGWVKDVALTMEEWKKQKEIYQNPKKHKLFEIACSTFYLNRCNRSGIIAGAGPIGGYEQKGSWKLDARFNRNMLSDRVTQIGKLKKHIKIFNMDAIDFLKKQLPRGQARNRVLVYCDPPYVSAGDKLYLNFYENNDHGKLAHYLIEQKGLHWVVSYDDNQLIRKLYEPCQKWIFSLGYSLQSSNKGRELLIAPQYLNLPGRKSITTARWKLVRKINSPNKSMEVLV
jgi:DNA adenine methylase